MGRSSGEGLAAGVGTDREEFSEGSVVGVRSGGEEFEDGLTVGLGLFFVLQREELRKGVVTGVGRATGRRSLVLGLLQVWGRCGMGLTDKMESHEKKKRKMWTPPLGE